MLKLRNLHKTYRSKNGEKHHALKGINLELGNKGFIVLLGRSGSGKSTLLNIIGGLDNFDHGEIIIKEKSTKEFKSNEWDSYRNTYVGFVFQEFYIIEEFSVGKNIALALELQGYQSEEVEKKVVEILKQVDLDGYIDRKPNEISGGQKQRIAIARALVKDPQIILADEPTGNLDSETGRIVLETLKKLSESKLVIMVTHDADFAREYGDRIIELKDGLIVNDFINHQILNEEIYNLDDKVKSVIKLPQGRTLTQKTINYINQLLTTNEKDVYLSITDNEDFIKTLVPNISTTNTSEQTQDATLRLSEDSNDEFMLKKTSLPLRYAFKLALSSLFTKKIKLTFMTFLFIASLVFLGIATNFSFYDINKATYLTFEKENIRFVPLRKEVKHCIVENKRTICDNIKESISEDELNTLNQKYKDLDLFMTKSIDLPFYKLFDKELAFPESSFFYTDRFNTVAIVNNDSNLNLVSGTYPMDHEIMITDFMAESLLAYKAFNVDVIEDLVNKVIFYNDQPIRIVGIVETDYKKYEYLKIGAYNISSSFYKAREKVYQQIFMNKQTYIDTFEEKSIMFSVFVHHQDYDSLSNITASSIDESYENYLIGDSRIPQNDDEIVITLSGLSEIYNLYIEGNEKEKEYLLNDYLNKNITINFSTHFDYKENGVRKQYKIVGLLDNLNNPEIKYFTVMFSFAEFKNIRNIVELNTMTGYLGNNHNENEKFIQQFEQLNYKHETRYSNMLYTMSSILDKIKTGLYIAGGTFAVFAGILIFTFISTSISYKQKEIGTLRAIGARGIDVSKIFITEGILIALFSSIVGNIVANVILRIMNDSITKDFNLSIVVLYINIYSILSVFVLSLFVVLIATFIPIKRLTVMKPIKAIKNIK